MVWGFVRKDGLRNIALVEGSLNGQKYQNILSENLLPYLEEENLFQQDGAPCQHERVLRKSRNCSFAGLASSIARFKHNRDIWAEIKQKQQERPATSLHNLWTRV